MNRDSLLDFDFRGYDATKAAGGGDLNNYPAPWEDYPAPPWFCTGCKDWRTETHQCQGGKCECQCKEGK